MPAAPIRALTWVLATVVVTGTHLGIYAILVHEPAAEAPPPPPAAVMVDLAPAPTVDRSEVDNQATGPASTARDEASPPDAPPTSAPALAAPPVPPDPKSEAVLAPAQPERAPGEAEVRRPEAPAPRAKPRQKAEPVRTPKPARAERAVAARNGGGPRSDQRTADRTAAPAAAAGDTSGAEARIAWQSEIRGRIVRSKRFPSEAHGATGVALVSVTFTASGGASNVRLAASSGSAALDAEAIAVMSRAAPYPPPPGGRATALTIPLNFRR